MKRIYIVFALILVTTVAFSAVCPKGAPFDKLLTALGKKYDFSHLDKVSSFAYSCTNEQGTKYMLYVNEDGRLYSIEIYFHGKGLFKLMPKLLYVASLSTGKAPYLVGYLDKTIVMYDRGLKVWRSAIEITDTVVMVVYLSDTIRVHKEDKNAQMQLTELRRILK